MKKIFGCLILLSGIILAAYSSAAEEPHAVNDSHFVQANGNDNAAPVKSRKNVKLPNAEQSNGIGTA